MISAIRQCNKALIPNLSRMIRLQRFVFGYTISVYFSLGGP